MVPLGPRSSLRARSTIPCGRRSAGACFRSGRPAIAGRYLQSARLVFDLPSLQPYEFEAVNRLAGPQQRRQFGIPNKCPAVAGIKEERRRVPRGSMATTGKTTASRPSRRRIGDNSATASRLPNARSISAASRPPQESGSGVRSRPVPSNFVEARSGQEVNSHLAPAQLHKFPGRGAF